RGFSIVVQHPAGWATYYTHLALPLVVEGQAVATAEPIGFVGYDPSTSRKLRHLHFELWRGGTRAGVVDPAPYLAAWGRARLPDRADEAVLLARNGSLSYRPVGDRGEPYPAWLRALKGKSGVYVIREGGEPVYVGESHSDRLYETLTRHFQTWRRRKSFWSGQFTEGHDPGLTYDRAAVEVAARETPAGRAI